MTQQRSAATPQSIGGSPTLMLVLATVGFAVNFWAWALLSPLAPALKQELGLTAFQQSLVVAVPVIVGSLGRIPAGALTDRFGARVMFPAVSALTVLPVLYLGHVAGSFTELVVGGFFLGLGGSTFAIGVPFVNAWFPPERRGFAVGVFGAGMVGTAISAFTTVRLADAQGRAFPFDLVAVVLLVFAVVAWLLLRDRPDRVVPTGSVVQRILATLRMPDALMLSFLYAVAFGGYVAFSVYLPTYLENAYGLELADASLRTAGFVVLAVIARPTGGYLSDRWHPVPIVLVVFVGVAALAFVASLELPLFPFATMAFLGMAGLLGLGTGAVFALVARVVEPAKVGAVSGVVGAAGGLGGFFPPLVMGAVFGATGDYTVGYLLLSLTAALAALFTLTVVRRRVVV